MSEQTTANPLKGFMRTPALYVSLPSDGKFYDEGVIQFDRNNELAVYPMTASDELLARSPDALLNGDSVYKAIASCVPGVIKPLVLTAKDAQTLLTAIRCATYGETQEIIQVCPKCRAENKYEMNLRNVLASIEPYTEFESFKTDNGLEIVITPITYDATLATTRFTFENAQMLANMSSLANEEQTLEQQTAQMELFRNSFAKMATLNLKILTESIQSITIKSSAEGTQDTVVKDKEHIAEYLRNCDSKTSKQIEETVTTYNNSLATEEVEAVCQECEHEWKSPLEFDPVQFFTGS